MRKIINRYFLEIREEGHRIPVGNPAGYTTLDEARKAALAKVDDALPRNTVQVFLCLGHGYLGGDGESYWHDEAGDG